MSGVRTMRHATTALMRAMARKSFDNKRPQTDKR